MMPADPPTLEPKPDARAPAVDPLRIVMPIVIGMLFLGAWEAAVRIYHVPPYILPGPWAILGALIEGWGSLFHSLLITLQVTLSAFLLAAVGGGALAILFTRSRWIELSLYPYAVILQVTPIVAIAPLIIIWVKDDTYLALLICAWIVAFFPVLSNATLGLSSTDHNLLNLFQLFGATRRQVLWHLRVPSALPYYLGGVRIAGGLALIGTVVAEFVAGTGGADTGLAYRILEAGYRLQIPRMFAALFLIAFTGILIFLGLSLVTHLVLRNWHESAVRRES
ncbi:MAG TPA: ABC transporter permease [Candidatus Sulfotelmatobacter sp.]|nr:ABC transporter permease [Candidatus Sulfotelmatobacter sp.]